MVDSYFIMCIIYVYIGYNPTIYIIIYIYIQKWDPMGDLTTICG